MKKLFLYIIFLFAPVVFAQIQTQIDTSRIKIGEPLHLRVTVPFQRNHSIQFPAFEDTLSYHIDILEKRIDTILRREKEEIQLNLDITSFEPGEFLVKPIPIYINNDTVYSRSFQMEVLDVEIDSANLQGYPIKPIMGEEYKLVDYWNKYWIYIIVLFLFLIVLIIIIFLFVRERLKTKDPVEIIKTPYEEAKDRLKSLDKHKYIEKGKVKDYYSELSHILRNYFGRRYEFSSLELLSDDLYNYLDEKKHLQEEDLIQLKEFLIDSDLAKYAKVIPREEKHDLYRKWVENIVEKTKPLMEEMEEDTYELKPNERYRKRKYFDYD